MNALEFFCDTVLCCLKVFLAFVSEMTFLALTNKIKASKWAVGCCGIDFCFICIVQGDF